jgi:hypothetical protein
MATSPITQQNLIDAATDAQTLANVTNGVSTATVTTRLGTVVPTVANVLRTLSVTPLPNGIAANAAGIISATVARATNTAGSNLADPALFTNGSWGITTATPPALTGDTYNLYRKSGPIPIAGLATIKINLAAPAPSLQSGIMYGWTFVDATGTIVGQVPQTPVNTAITVPVGALYLYMGFNYSNTGDNTGSGAVGWVASNVIVNDGNFSAIAPNLFDTPSARLSAATSASVNTLSNFFGAGFAANRNLYNPATALANSFGYNLTTLVVIRDTNTNYRSNKCLVSGISSITTNIALPKAAGPNAGNEYGCFFVDSTGNVINGSIIGTSGPVAAGTVIPVPPTAIYFCMNYNFSDAGGTTPASNADPTTIRVADAQFAISTIGPYVSSAIGGIVGLGRDTTAVISYAGGKLAATADFIIPQTGAEVQINSIIAALQAVSPQGIRIVLDRGFSTANSITLDGDNIELCGISHGMWYGYNHGWQNTSNPAGAIGPTAHITATGSYPIVAMAHTNVEHGSGSDANRHRGTNIHDLYLVGNNYTGTGIQITGNDDNVILHDLVIQRVAIGLDVALDSPQIFRNSLQDLIDGIHLNGLVFARVTENLIFDIGGVGLTVGNCPNTIVSGNIFGDCYAGAIAVTSPGCIIRGNQFATNNNNTITLSTSANHALIDGNMFDNSSSLYGFSSNGTFPNAYDIIHVSATIDAVLIAHNIFTAITNTSNTGFAINFASIVTNGIVSSNIIRGTYNAGSTPLSVGSNQNINNVVA